MTTCIGWLLGLAATFAWASFYIVGRWLFGEGGETLNPFLYNFLRFAIAVATLTPMMAKRENARLLKQALCHDLLTFLLLSLVGMLLESFLVSYSMNFTTASRCSLMTNISPIATVLLAALMLKQPITRRMFLGMTIGFVGLFLAAFSQGGDIYASTSARTLIGDTMAASSGFCWAFFTVAGVRVSRKYGGFVSMFTGFLLGTIIQLPLVLILTSAADWHTLTPQLWSGIVYTAVVTLALANVCWNSALRHIRPGVLGALGYLSAVLTFVLSALVLDENFTPSFVIAILLALSGMAIMMNHQPSEKEKIQ